MLIRVLDNEGVSWFEGHVPVATPYINIPVYVSSWDHDAATIGYELAYKTVAARRDYYLPSDDGGPMYIYRFNRMDVK